MRKPTTAVLSLLARAAELRAGGASWDAVGGKLARSPDTCRQWPRLYSDDWRRLYRAAAGRLTEEAGAEALTVLRALLRSEDEKVRRDAAQRLLDLCHEAAPKGKEAERPDGDNERIAAYLGERDDAQIEAIVEELLSRRPEAGGQRADAAPPRRRPARTE